MNKFTANVEAALTTADAVYEAARVDYKIASDAASAAYAVRVTTRAAFKDAEAEFNNARAAYRNALKATRSAAIAASVAAASISAALTDHSKATHAAEEDQEGNDIQVRLNKRK